MNGRRKSKACNYQPFAERDIRQIKEYIESEGYPLNASKFLDRMYSFIESLYIYPLVHSECHFRKFKRRSNWRCAVFENNYIIAYKIFKIKITIHAVINAARLK